MNFSHLFFFIYENLVVVLSSRRLYFPRHSYFPFCSFFFCCPNLPTLSKKDSKTQKREKSKLKSFSHLLWTFFQCFNFGQNAMFSFFFDDGSTDFNTFSCCCCFCCWNLVEPRQSSSSKEALNVRLGWKWRKIGLEWGARTAEACLMDLQIKIYVIFLLSLPLFCCCFSCCSRTHLSSFIVCFWPSYCHCCCVVPVRVKRKRINSSSWWLFLSLLSFFDVSTLQGIIIFDLALGFISQEERVKVMKQKIPNI